ncbi:hypothetical protein COCON_G00098130 [Conger conger]|uniref:Uncharacterized protein n=1 Tax=Conger conger TaxID=82655 RepID=A0A9Q1DMC2_CONCO|nr:hypothetical protein COCON_G00098130 [Conger conger]
MGCVQSLHEIPEDELIHWKKIYARLIAIVLGNRRDPHQLILVDVNGGMNAFPPAMIKDDYGRDFRLQFLLLGIITANSNHMVLCTSLDVGWWLYDAMEPSLFRNVNVEDIQTQGYVVNLAAYVKVPANNVKQD